MYEVIGVVYNFFFIRLPDRFETGIGYYSIYFFILYLLAKFREQPIKFEQVEKVAHNHHALSHLLWGTEWPTTPFLYYFLIFSQPELDTILYTSSFSIHVQSFMSNRLTSHHGHVPSHNCPLGPQLLL